MPAPVTMQALSFSRATPDTASATAEPTQSTTASTPSRSNHWRARDTATSGRFWWSACSTSTERPRPAGPKSSTACRTAATETGPDASRKGPERSVSTPMRSGRCCCGADCAAGHRRRRTHGRHPCQATPRDACHRVSSSLFGVPRPWPAARLHDRRVRTYTGSPRRRTPVTASEPHPDPATPAERRGDASDEAFLRAVGERLRTPTRAPRHHAPRPVAPLRACPSATSPSSKPAAATSPFCCSAASPVRSA